MDALVTYQYYATGAEQGTPITIRSDEIDVDLNRYRTTPHEVGETVTLQAEEEEEAAIEKLGKDPKEYVVSNCVHILSQTAEHSPQLSVYVGVTDPD